MASPSVKRAASLRDLLGGVHVTVRVGSLPQHEDFLIPKALLCETSNYFKKMLNGSFREAKENLVILDEEEIEIFRTYAAWLYLKRVEVEMKQNDLDGYLTYEHHLVRLYLFAEERDIPRLKNEVITCLSKYTSKHGPLLNSTIRSTYGMIPKRCPLHDFLVDDMTYGIGIFNWAHEKQKKGHQSLPDEFCLDVLRACLPKASGALERPRRPSEHLCDYHEHDDYTERAECAKARRTQ